MHYIRNLALAGTLAITGAAYADHPAHNLKSEHPYTTRPHQQTTRGLHSYNRKELINLIETERRRHKAETSILDSRIKKLEQEHTYNQHKIRRLRETIKGYEEQADEHRAEAEEWEDTNASLLQKLHSTQALLEQYSTWADDMTSRFLSYHGITERQESDRRYFYIKNQREEPNLRKQRKVDMGYPSLNVTVQQNHNTPITNKLAR